MKPYGESCQMFLSGRAGGASHGMLKRWLNGRLRLQSPVVPRVRQPPPQPISAGKESVVGNTPVQIGHILSKPLPRHPFVTLSDWGGHQNVVVHTQKQHPRDRVGRQILLRRAVGPLLTLVRIHLGVHKPWQVGTIANPLLSRLHPALSSWKDRSCPSTCIEQV